MLKLNRILCCLALIAITFSAGEAKAWHGHHHRGFVGYPFGYGLGYSSIGYRSFGYSSYYSFGGWPYRSYYSSYSVAPISIGYSYRPTIFYRSCLPSISYSTYYAPSYYTPIYYAPAVPVYSTPVYSTYYPSCYSTPVNHNATYTGFASSAPLTSSSTFASNSSLSSSNYSSLKPILASSTSAGAEPQPLTTRYVASSSTPVQTVSTVNSTDAVPADLLQSADAILAAGGYREAAQAYAQLAVRFGPSDRLNLRRFIAQVASGDYEQAAVIVDLAMASGSDLQNVALPAASLEAALGASTQLIAQRAEGLAANALHQPSDAVPMAAVATWLTLSGDLERAELFTLRANQLRGVAPIAKAIAPRS